METGGGSWRSASLARIFVKKAKNWEFLTSSSRPAGRRLNDVLETDFRRIVGQWRAHQLIADQSCCSRLRGVFRSAAVVGAGRSSGSRDPKSRLILRQMPGQRTVCDSVVLLCIHCHCSHSGRRSVSCVAEIEPAIVLIAVGEPLAVSRSRVDRMPGAHRLVQQENPIAVNFAMSL